MEEIIPHVGKAHGGRMSLEGGGTYEYCDISICKIESAGQRGAGCTAADAAA